MHRLPLLAVFGAVAGCSQGPVAKEDPCQGVTCDGHGACAETDNGQAVCHCAPGFRAVGPSCVGDCTGEDCGGLGGCVVIDNEPTCLCDYGYVAQGLDCRAATTCQHVTCSGRGTCVEPDGKPACVCEVGYVPVGLACAPNQCTGVSCSDHGGCVFLDGAPWCECDYGYEAVGLSCRPTDCQRTGCNGHGVCMHDEEPERCVCDHGYVAVGAECRPEVCADVECSGRGACVAGPEGPQCRCDPGYAAVGLSCRPRCVDIDCDGHGTCFQDGEQLSCLCDPGYRAEGQRCVADGTHDNDVGDGDGGDPADVGDGDGGAPDSSDGGGDSSTSNITCHPDYTCFEQPGRDVVWVLGGYNVPCSRVCRDSLGGSDDYYVCDQGRSVEYTDVLQFSEIAFGLGFACRPGRCWDAVTPADGVYAVSTGLWPDGDRSCYLPDEPEINCSSNFGNANCWGVRFAAVCPCVSKSVEWVAIAGGSFTMGSAGGESNEQPPHTVSVGDFEIGRTEVTVAEYGRCVALGVCTAPDTGSAANWNVNNRDLFPVNYVSWQQAADFCAWAGGRLPTEAEWEFAARSRGVTTAYPWGEEPATCDYAVMDDGGAGCGSGSSRAVCSREAGNTAEGLCDMAGNGREWVQDLYHLTYDGAPADGSAWEVNGTLRVVRGGSYDLAADDLRASARMGYHPVLQAATVSFRCARDAS